MSTLKRAKLRHLSIFLLKKDSETDESVLKSADLIAYNLDDNLDFTGMLYVRPPSYKEPDWVQFVRQGLTNSLDTLQNSNTSGVIILKAAKRRFAICFGYGRYLIHPESYERHFGLRVVLNCVDPKSLRSVDVKTLEDLTVHTRRQTSQATEFQSFGVDIASDLLCGVVGRPTDPSIAESIAGSDSIVASCRINFRELGQKCKQLLNISKKQNYKADYDFIDNLLPVGPSDQDALDRLLEADLQHGNLDAIHMAPPEILDWDRTQGFLLPGEHPSENAHDLDIEQYLATFNNPGEITIDDLKRARIRIKNTDDEVYPGWSVYNTIVYEIDRGKSRFILSSGEWYKASQTYAEKIAKELQTIPAFKAMLPGAFKDEHEDDYNERASKIKGFTLMDRHNIRCEQARTDMEVCDIFSDQKQFIHVKRKTRSATLSHLFLQGVNSAEAFLEDSKYRKLAIQELHKRSDQLRKIVKLSEPKQLEYEIAYCIITPRAKNWPSSLPFFSQISLTNAARHLRNRGFKVSLGRIHES